MSEDDLLDIIHATMMEWAKEEYEANEEGVTLYQRFEEARIGLVNALQEMPNKRSYSARARVLRVVGGTL
tara:strand:- start:172 stop:381 length:210 start_codon:yes stop_codon:yes gene_type:complete